MQYKMNRITRRFRFLQLCFHYLVNGDSGPRQLRNVSITWRFQSLVLTRRFHYSTFQRHRLPHRSYFHIHRFRLFHRLTTLEIIAGGIVWSHAMHTYHHHQLDKCSYNYLIKMVKPVADVNFVKIIDDITTRISRRQPDTGWITTNVRSRRRCSIVTWTANFMMVTFSFDIIHCTNKHKYKTV